MESGYPDYRKMTTLLFHQHVIFDSLLNGLDYSLIFPSSDKSKKRKFL